MGTWAWSAVGVAAVLGLYAAFLLALVLGGRRHDVRAVAGFIPDCIVLVGRLLRSGGLTRAQKVPVGLLLVYLAMPIDLVPDVIPVAGQLDDAILAAWVLRRLVRAAGPEVVREHWPGPAASVELLIRGAGGPRPS